MPVRVKSSAALPFGLPVPPAGWPQKPPGISLCMIVRDEERFLERCLQSARGAVDEIVVIDTGSKDRTIEIARSFGAVVEQREWRDDFAWARNQALKLARYRWILQLDADEELLEESKPALEQLRRVPAYFTGLWVRCINRADQYLGDVATLSHTIVRVFPNHERIRYYGRIHESPTLDGATTTISGLGSPVKILHHGYMSDVVQDRSKLDRNIAIIEAATGQKPDDSFNWYNLGITLFLGGQYERSVEALKRMWEIAQAQGARPFIPNGLTVLADALTDNLSRAEQGLQFAREALKLAPRYCSAHFSAGRALEALNRHDEAREMFLAAIDDGKYIDRQFVADEDVPVWKAHNMIGGTYAAQGDDVSALHWFEAGLKNRSKVQPLRLNRANTLERLGRLQEAENALRELCEEIGDEQSILQYVNFMLRHKPLEAVEAIEAYHAKCGKPAAVALLLGAAAVVQRHGMGDGEKYLSAAQRIAPESAEVLGPLEAVYRARNDEAAIQRLRMEEAATLPETPLDFARRAQIAIQQREFERALSWAEQGLKETPKDAMLRYSAASACSNLNRKTDALAHLDAITELTADVQLHVLLLRASLLESIGRNDEAEAAFCAALPLSKKRVAAELGGFYLRAGRFADAQRVAEDALA